MSRTRYVYRLDENGIPAAVQVASDFESTRGLQAPLTDLYMDGTRATDGTDIGSRTKRNAYMRENNLADAGDFKGTWATAEAKREAFRRGDGPSMRAALEEAMHKQERGKR